MNIDRFYVEDRIWNFFQRSPYLVQTGVSATDRLLWVKQLSRAWEFSDRETGKTSERHIGDIADIAEERGPGQMEKKAGNQEAVKWAHWTLQEGIVGSCIWQWAHHETTEWWGQDWFCKLPGVWHSRLLWTECFVFSKIPVLKPNP